MTSSLAETVAAEIRAEMARQHKNQWDLAECLGITRSVISLRLNGHRPFKLTEVELLADYFGVPITSLIRERAA
jgi:transcriptional regulator with XRE-family HTH domain